MLSFQTIPQKEQWYRLPEREKTKTPIESISAGGRITASRVIIRTGYYVSPMDAPADELPKMARAYYLNYVKDEKAVDAFIRANDGELPKNVAYKLRGRWCSQNCPSELQNLRTFWYYSLPRPKNMLVHGIVYRKTGERVWGHGPSSDFGDDYESNSFLEWVHQGVYTTYYNGMTVFIHPLDALKEG